MRTMAMVDQAIKVRHQQRMLETSADLISKVAELDTAVQAVQALTADLVVLGGVPAAALSDKIRQLHGVQLPDFVVYRQQLQAVTSMLRKALRLLYAPCNDAWRQQVYTCLRAIMYRLAYVGPTELEIIQTSVINDTTTLPPEYIDQLDDAEVLYVQALRGLAQAYLWCRHNVEGAAPAQVQELSELLGEISEGFGVCFHSIEPYMTAAQCGKEEKLQFRPPLAAVDRVLAALTSFADAIPAVGVAFPMSPEDCVRVKKLLRNGVVSIAKTLDRDQECIMELANTRTFVWTRRTNAAPAAAAPVADATTDVAFGAFTTAKEGWEAKAAQFVAEHTSSENERIALKSAAALIALAGALAEKPHLPAALLPAQRSIIVTTLLGTASAFNKIVPELSAEAVGTFAQMMTQHSTED